MTYPADENNQREVVSYHYLPQKLLYSLTGDAAYVEASQYDEAGRLTRRALGARDATQAPLAVQYQYAGWGPDANANDDYYDGQGRLMSITSGTENAPGALLDLSYRYDIGGNITQITDANLGPQVQSFGYDALDRIVSAQAVGGSVGTYSESYSYDGEGRLHTKGGVAYFYESSHKHAVSRLSNNDQFSYDANGSMTTRKVGANTFTLVYDAELHLTEVKQNGATIASFGYDGDGQMVSASVGGVTTSYVGGYFEWQTNGSLSASTKYYSAGSAKTAMRRAGVVTYLLGDHLGSTSVAYDDGSTTARRQGYTAFGSERYNLGGDLPTRYKYTGQRGFEEIGLYFYNARWYDSAVGRFAQADTLIPNTKNPADWDRYSYGLNNPSRYTDPTGHFTEDEIQQYFGVETWDAVLNVFQEGGALEGRWGWLTVLQRAELGDEISISWDKDQLPNGHPNVESTFTGKFELDKSGRLIISGESSYMDQIKAAKYGANYSLMHYTSDDAKKAGAAFLIAVTDITVGIPAFGLILSAQPHLMKAGEALETLVVLPVNILGVKMWRDAEHGKLEEVLNVSAIPDQNIPYRPYRNQEPN